MASHLASTPSLILFLASQASSRKRHLTQNGFTLPEVLVSVIIVTIAVLGSIVAANLIFSSIRGTEIRADQNRAIDRDVARIVALSENYGACTNPLGSAVDTCTDANPGDSFYYFPADPANIVTFENACADGSIVNGFITAIGQLPATEAGVSRDSVARLTGAAGNNHLVEITWTDGPGGDDLRSIQITPLVSAWCP